MGAAADPQSLQNHPRGKANFTGRIKPITSVKPPLQKYLSFFFSENVVYSAASRLGMRGVSRSSRDVGAGRDGREVATARFPACGRMAVLRT